MERGDDDLFDRVVDCGIALDHLFGAVGKGIREFRKEAEAPADRKVTTAETEPVTTAQTAQQ